VSAERSIEPAENPFRLDRRDVAKVIGLGLAQAGSLIAFTLLLILVSRAVGADTLGPVAEAAWRTTLLQLAGLTGVAVLYGSLRGWEFTLAEKIGYELVRRLRMRMYGHLQGMTPAHVQGRSRGGLLLRFIGDLSMLRTWLSRGLLAGVVAVAVLVPTLVTLAVLNYRIGLTLVAVLAAGAAASLASGRSVRRATRSMRRRRSLLISNLDEQLHSLSVVQVFGRSGGEHARLSRQNESLNRSLYRVAELRGRLRAITSAVALLSVVSVLLVGMVEVRNGSATVGLVVAALVMSRLLTTHVRTLGLAHDYWHRSQISRQKVLEFLRSSSRELDPPDLERLRVGKGGVRFHDVTVPGALSGITLEAMPGQLIAVTGPNGAGKSTLLNLIARLVEPTGGEIRVDGQDLLATTPRSTFRKIGMMSPDLPLMRGTVRRNLLYSRPDAEPDELTRVIYAAGLDGLLAELPDGLATWLIEGGRNLSAGQRQRIALGRALLGNPPILLLDEPTSNLDPQSREMFRTLIGRHHGTVLLATNDPDEIALADQVWTLGGGRVQRTCSGEQYRDDMWLAGQGRVTWAPLASH
jgi:ABC-type multidrug transport system fused ATPase/permease subunit